MAADIGLPPAALRPLQPAQTEQAALQTRELLQQQKQQQQAAAQLLQQQKQQQEAAAQLLHQQQQAQQAAAQLLQQQQQAAAAQLIQQQQAAAELAAAQQRQQQRVAVLGKSTASKIVKEWLVSVQPRAVASHLHASRQQDAALPLTTSILSCLPCLLDPALADRLPCLACPAGHQG
jgi:hypothetical protein